jgi:hypothetical protein
MAELITDLQDSELRTERLHRRAETAQRGDDDATDPGDATDADDDASDAGDASDSDADNTDA